MKFSIFTTLWILFLCNSKLSIAQQEKTSYKYINGHTLTKSGQWPVSTSHYHRIDSSARMKLPAPVQRLCRRSSGINILFQTNSRSIAVKWKLAEYEVFANMTPIAANGVDLYGWNGRNWQYVSVGIPKKDTNTSVVINNLKGDMVQYRLYLPLYSELIDIQIGVESDAVIRPVDSSRLPKKRIAIYGSSITQGSSASRPGMAYPSILSRMLNTEIINLGFSGNGKMEIELVDVIAKIPADVYILDCVPNPTPEQIKERSYPFLRKLRELKPGIPIVMVESITREKSFWDQEAWKKVSQQNAEFRKTYEKIISEGEKQIYYIKSEDLIGNDHEATIDGTHLTDLGFMRLAECINKVLIQLL